MYKYSFQNKTNLTSGIPQQLAGSRINNWIQINLLYPFAGYILPELVFLTIVNNVLVLIIFITSKNVKQRVKSSIRIYYIATAIGDIIVCIPVHLTYFLCTVYLDTIFSVSGLKINSNIFYK